MDRVRTEGRGNRLGVGVVAGLDIRSNHVLHALSWRGLSHRGDSSFCLSNKVRCGLHDQEGSTER